MKNAQKFIFKFTIALISLLGIVCCERYEKKTDNSAVTAEDVEDIIIPNEQAKELYDTYTDRREGLIQDFENALDSVGQDKDTYNAQDQQAQNIKDQSKKADAQQSREGFQVVRYGFYDFEDLKKYMAFIDQEAKKANVNISTLRVYFANYPDKEKFGNGRPIKEARRNTFVMIPTVNTGNEEFAFFTADDSEDGQRKAFLLTEDLTVNGKSYRANAKEEASLLPNAMLFDPTNAPMPPENIQSLAGNEWGLRPPK